MTDDALGAAFERSLPRDEQRLLGQFYTPRPVADLLVALTVGDACPTVLDPGCGSGGLLLSAYDHLAWRWRLPHAELLARLWGVERNPAAAALALANLAQHGEEAAARIVVGDFFAQQPDALPEFTCILGNPPYLRSQNQDDLDPDERRRLFAAATRAGVQAHPKTDLFAFFVYHASRFMKAGARLGFVTPASWLTADYAAALQTLLTGGLRLRALVASNAESFCPQVDVRTVLVVVERVEAAETVDAGEAPSGLRFVTLKQPISRLVAGPGAHWDRVAALAAEICGPQVSREDERLRVNLVPAAGEREALRAAPTVPRNWSRYVRAPLSFEALAGSAAFTPLEQLAKVSLGYKSLQNEFYYVDRATIEQYAIEPRFLSPILMLGDLDGGRFLQDPPRSQWVFLCREPQAALQGTGALRYIEAMADRPVAQRKQSGPARTIRAVLQAQGGGLWYGPKARPHAAHVWLRKAIDAVYAPLLFAQASVVDQRCNYLEPVAGLSWELLAAALTGTAFALAVEVHGSASMGGGALEAPTTKLRTYPVLDPRPLARDDRETLIHLARAVWTEERPIDWSAPGAAPGPRLQALDAWVLARAGAGHALDRLHEDLRAACRTRIDVARATSLHRRAPK